MTPEHDSEELYKMGSLRIGPGVATDIHSGRLFLVCILPGEELDFGNSRELSNIWHRHFEYRRNHKPGSQWLGLLDNVLPEE